MPNIDIQTTQNVQINYSLAGVGDRIAAYLIDSLILTAYFFVLAMLFILCSRLFEGLFDTRAGIVVGIILSLLLVLPALMYHLLMEVFMNGQSFGKRLLKIKVARLNGTEPRFMDYFMRWVFRALEIASCSGSIALLSVIISRNAQRLGDLAAGTTVIRTKPRTQLKDLIHFKPEEGYQIVFPQVRGLKDEEVIQMKKIMNSGFRSGNPVLFEKLASKMKDVLVVESDLPAITFLETLIKDYNHYHSAN